MPGAHRRPRVDAENMETGWMSLLWVDSDLSSQEERVDIEKPLLLNEAGAASEKSVEAALKLASAVAQAETDRETNLNARGAAVASVAALVVSVFAAVAKSVFATRTDWTGWTRDSAEALFIGALVVVAGAMAMAVIGVLRPTRGGKTKNTVGEAVVNVWRQDRGEVTLATAGEKSIGLFWLDRLLLALPAWHYRNRRKVRWLRRAWMFLMLGIILIGVAAVIVLVELRVAQPGEAAAPAQPEITWVEVAGIIAGTLILGWLALVFDLIGAVRPEAEMDRARADSEAKNILEALGMGAAEKPADLESTVRRADS
jgi:NADH:ubiquinone oxidoreductase subunit 6 (subunit J)